MVLCIPVLQLLYLSLNFDAYVIVLKGTASGWKAFFGYFGQIAKVAVLFVFIFFLLLKARLVPYWKFFVNQTRFNRILLWLLPQLVAYVFLVLLSKNIFDESSREIAPIFYFGWLLSAMCCGAFFLLMAGSYQALWTLAKREWIPASASFAIATVVWWLSSQAADIWGPMSEYTFMLVALGLAFINDAELYVDLDEKVVGLGDFAVNIAPACSGYEGIGLITAFTAIYLYLCKDEFRFPRALLLFPLGAVAIWLLNAVRITVLVLIGAHWSPDVAVGGFHSQAGWITFISTSIALLWLAKKIAFFTRPLAGKTETDLEHTRSVVAQSDDANIAIATLVPMVVLLAVILVTSAVSAGFDWLYPLRPIAVALALFWAASYLPWRPYKPRFEAVMAGFVVAIVWILMLSGTADEANQEFADALWSADLWLAGTWLAFRFVGSVVTVPIAEELAFRAYLLCKFSTAPVSIRGTLPVSVVAVLASSLAFGALHGAWLAGTFAGLVYALVRLRSNHIGDAIVAHAVTNAMLFGYASYSGEWVLI